MRIQTKIAVLFTVVCTSILVIIASIIYFFSYTNAFEDFYTRLELRAVISAKAHLDPKDQLEAYEQVRYQHLQRLPKETEHITTVDSLNYLLNDKVFTSVPASFFNDIRTRQNASFRKGYQFFKGITYTARGVRYVIIITAVHQYAQNFLLNLQRILLSTIIASTIFIFTIGIVFSKSILLPVRRIAHEVMNISATSLNKRLTVKKGKDEISELGNTFNSMLNRLETSFATQNNFVSNASHELNTPLTAIIGEAELALKKPRATEDYQQSLSVILKQGEKLRNITKSLLELAQSGFTGSLNFEVIKISELMSNVQKVVKSIYPDCHLEVDRSLQPLHLPDMYIKGNFNLLELGLSNVVLNACKYSNGQMVTLALGETDQHIVFIVRDRGIGIPKQDMVHIFDPFFRASNVKDSKGYGIGLPLANNIIGMHNGSINVSSKEGEGTEVVVKIAKV